MSFQAIIIFQNKKLATCSKSFAVKVCQNTFEPEILWSQISQAAISQLCSAPLLQRIEYHPHIAAHHHLILRLYVVFLRMKFWGGTPDDPRNPPIFWVPSTAGTNGFSTNHPPGNGGKSSTHRGKKMWIVSREGK